MIKLKNVFKILLGSHVLLFFYH